MKKSRYNVIGLMSGTSCDGLDLAYCQFEHGPKEWNYEMIHTRTFLYEKKLQNHLKNCVEHAAFELFELDIQLGKLYGAKVREFVNEFKVDVDFISSHGHTVFHQVKKGLTVQIGNLSAIHQESGLPVIGDFRIIDVLKSGQGAPLVPVGDKFLFSEFDACINLGGIANISLINRDQPIAYDVSVCNLLLNKLAGEKGLAFDENGTLAAQGKIIQDLLLSLEELGFQQMVPPKSLGVEYVKEHLYPLFESDHSTADKLLTACHHIAKSLAEAIKKDNSIRKILVSGGGVHNSTLMQLIRNNCPDHAITILDDKLSDFKEALVFAFLGVLKVRKDVNIFRSVTGASSDSCSGTMVGF